MTLDSELSAMGREIDCALLVDVAPEVIIDRLSSRRTCRACGYTGTAADATCPKCGGESSRDDDKPEPIKNRLDVYEKSTSRSSTTIVARVCSSRSTVTRLARPCTGMSKRLSYVVKDPSATQIEQMKKAGALSKMALRH